MASSRPVFLLDSNVLIALADLQHELNGCGLAMLHRYHVKLIPT